jgi:SAM-dependent methyltransferase
MALLGDETDRDWERFGRDDPYFGVVVEPRFHRDALTAEALDDFFASGRRHVERVFEVIHRALDPAFAPKRSLEFGCGVGRVLIPLAERSGRAVGVDVSESMLREAARNCDARGITNVDLVHGSDALERLDGGFDLVHSFIVLQHVPPARGHRLFERLVDLVADDGIAVLHVLYANDLPPRARFARFARRTFRPVHRLLNLREGKPLDRPLMQMNRSDPSRIFRALQDRGAHECHVRFTHHFAHRGVVFFARKRAAASF